MPKKPRHRAIADAAKKIEMIEGLPLVIERKYRRLLRMAEAEWQRRFGGKEASGASRSSQVEPAKGVIKSHDLPKRHSRLKRGLARKGKKRGRRIRPD